jgi:ABC-type glutathione transport system ATPase component
MSSPILELDAVSKTFGTGADSVHAAQLISFAVNRGECLAIVGESGSGKSTVANMILGIYPPSSGEIRLDGKVLPAQRQLEHRRAIQLVQQNPLSSLNPKRSIGASLRLALDVHGIGAKNERADRVAALLEEVGLPADFAKRSPTALSGGQRQRVAIARALACQSEIVVLDEPTSALDVLVQARVLKLLNELRATRDLTFVFITHDLSVVRNIATRIAVFEKGRMVELGDTETLFANPDHPYTRRLISAVPVVTREEAELRNTLAAGLEETTE